MLTMEQQKYIRKCCIKKGESLNSVASRTGHDWRTIRKYVDQEDFSDKLIPTKRRNSILDRFKPIIDKWLEDDLKAPPKQRHTAVRVFNRLKDEYGEIFKASIRTVSTYVAAKKKEIYKDDHAYLPLTHPAGEAQVDFGELMFTENETANKGYYLNLSFPYSNASYWQIFRGQNLECLLTGLISIFEYIGGVPTTIWFDNLSPVVTSIKKHGERILNERFEKFSMHYGFDHNFCNPNSGHEKGNVESKVGYNRRNFFVPVPCIKSLAEYNKKLFADADKDMNRKHYKKDELICNLFQEDKEAMLTLPKYDFEVYRLEKYKANGYGKITIDKEYEYSISPVYASRQVWAKLTADKVTILDEDYKVLIIHDRLYGDKKESMNWLPYLELMAKRPNALKYTTFYQDLPDQLQSYFDACKLDEKRIGLKVLKRILTETSIDTATEIFEHALEKGFKDEDSLLTIYYRKMNQTPLQEDMKLPAYVPDIQAFKTDINAYDNFFKGGISE